MGSFSATFALAGKDYIVLACVHEAHQDGNIQGQPASKPYCDELRMTLLVSPGAMLDIIGWAADQQKELSGKLTFRADDGHAPSVTLSFEEGVCVSYEEHFESNTQGYASFYCQLSVVARTFTLGEVAFDNNWPL